MAGALGCVRVDNRYTLLAPRLCGNSSLRVCCCSSEVAARFCNSAPVMSFMMSISGCDPPRRPRCGFCAQEAHRASFLASAPGHTLQRPLHAFHRSNLCETTDLSCVGVDVLPSLYSLSLLLRMGGLFMRLCGGMRHRPRCPARRWSRACHATQSVLADALQAIIHIEDDRLLALSSVTSSPTC